MVSFLVNKRVIATSEATVYPH